MRRLKKAHVSNRSKEVIELYFVFIYLKENFRLNVPNLDTNALISTFLNILCLVADTRQPPPADKVFEYHFQRDLIPGVNHACYAGYQPTCNPV